MEAQAILINTVFIMMIMSKRVVFGAYFRAFQADRSMDVKEAPSISKEFHECGRDQVCNFVTKNLDTSEYRKYQSKDNLPQQIQGLIIWEKISLEDEEKEEKEGKQSNEKGKIRSHNQYFHDSNVLRALTVKAMSYSSGEFPNCQRALEQGIKTNTSILIPWGNGSSFQAPCDMTSDGGGWTIIQRRVHGNVSFTRDWGEYTRGFGEMSGDFWLGLHAMHHLTKHGHKTVRFELQNIRLRQGYAAYNRFVINSEAYNFSIILGTYEGNIGDAMHAVNGSQFSTEDRDNDNFSKNCAKVFKGPWWYNACSFARLNSLFVKLSTATFQDASDVMKWQSWENSNTTIIRSEIKIR